MCWDADPEARLSAANVRVRMEEFHDKELNQNEDDLQISEPNANQYSTTTHNDESNTPTIPNHFPNSPRIKDWLPPYFSHASIGLRQRQTDFLRSMPLIISGESHFDFQPPPRPAQSLRNCTIIEDETSFRQEKRQPASVRNSLVLGTISNTSENGTTKEEGEEEREEIQPSNIRIHMDETSSGREKRQLAAIQNSLVLGTISNTSENGTTREEEGEVKIQPADVRVLTEEMNNENVKLKPVMNSTRDNYTVSDLNFNSCPP